MTELVPRPDDGEVDEYGKDEWDRIRTLARDLGPVQQADCFVAVGQFDEDPQWMCYVLTPSVNKSLRFKHRRIGRFTTDELLGTLAAGLFFSEHGDAMDWTPETYSSNLGDGVLYGYITEMLLPQDWRDNPPMRERVRVWPIRIWGDDVPEEIRIKRGRALVLRLIDSFAREEVIQMIQARDGMLLLAITDKEN